MLISKNEFTENGSLKMLLPKGWELSDFSPTENLIEIEDTNDGSRFWCEPKALFRREIKLGENVNVVENNIVTTAKATRFDAKIFRKRCYLLAIFEFDETNPVPFDAKIHWPHYSGCR